MKIVINPTYKNFSDFVKSIPSIFCKDGNVIYKQRNEIKVFDIEGTKINVKRFCIPNFLNRIIYTYFKSSKAARAYNFALKLKERNIQTPEPIGYVITKHSGLISYSYFISKQIDYKRNMYEFGKGGIKGRENIITAFVQFTTQLHKVGIYHLDYSPGNILFKKEDGKIDFCLVDINRMKFGKVSKEQGYACFARMWGQEPFFRFVAKKYAEIMGLDVNLCTQNILHYRKKFWKKYTSKRPLPFATDEAAANNTLQLSVILSTYNQPSWLEKALWGYEAQTDCRFELIIADDGSDAETKNLIEQIKPHLSYSVKHIWQEKNGFRKCEILNKAILAASSNYLLFSDGDCIPRKDFVAVHLKYRKVGRFLSGGYHKLSMGTSQSITKDDILRNRCFNIKWLKKHGMKSSFKNNKLTSFGLKEKFMNAVTTTKPTWNGHNASGWLSDILAANGFDERMQYGGQDREFGERLENSGIHGKQIRYSAICIHLDHVRSYKTDASIKKNINMRKQTRKNKIRQTPYGIEKDGKKG